jgi:hypothetical protein
MFMLMSEMTLKVCYGFDTSYDTESIIMMIIDE